MHAQNGTVGSPEFNGLEQRFEVTLRWPQIVAEGFVGPSEEFASAMSADIADVILEMFVEEHLIPEARPEIGVRVL